VNEWVGGLLWVAAVLGLARLIWWLGRAMNTYEPHCVYRIPLTDGRVYIGYAKDPDKRLGYHRSYQKPLAEGNPRKWWPLVPAHVREARPLRMPAEWIESWSRSKPLAEARERVVIREHEQAGIVVANRIKYVGGAVALDEH
jgi:hypothetical protein